MESEKMGIKRWEAAPATSRSPYHGQNGMKGCERSRSTVPALKELRVCGKEMRLFGPEKRGCGEFRGECRTDKEG